MSSPTAPVYITGTGNIGGTIGGQVYSVTLTPAAAAATLVLREMGSGGAVIAAFQAAANGASFYGEYCFAYAGQLHATLSGSGATAMIEL